MIDVLRHFDDPSAEGAIDFSLGRSPRNWKVNVLRADGPIHGLAPHSMPFDISTIKAPKTQFMFSILKSPLRSPLTRVWTPGKPGEIDRLVEDPIRGFCSLLIIFLNNPSQSLTGHQELVRQRGNIAFALPVER
jgi:hypothetical protein